MRERWRSFMDGDGWAVLDADGFAAVDAPWLEAIYVRPQPRGERASQWRCTTPLSPSFARAA